MDLEWKIKHSVWWETAKTLPDPESSVNSGIMLADHLETVHRNLRWLIEDHGASNYYSFLKDDLRNLGIDPAEAFKSLQPVALLHCIGLTVLHPEPDSLEFKEIYFNSSEVSTQSALIASKLLNLHDDISQTVINLIKNHYIPYDWYDNYEKKQLAPTRRVLKRTSKLINPIYGELGLAFLALFILADRRPNREQRVTWYFEQLNMRYLTEHGYYLTPPPEKMLQHESNT